MEELLVERREGACIVTLNRPERSNSLSASLLEKLQAVGERLRRDESVRAVMLTGAGERAFSGGADLKERRGMSDAEVRQQIARYQPALGWLSAGHFPTVAAINGAALGGGLELALACDLRTARSRAKLGLVETTLGIIPAAGGTQRLTRLVGEAKAKELILLGRVLWAQEALELGLLHQVFEDSDDLIARTLDYIEPILSGAPLAQRAALAAINIAHDVPLSEGLILEQRHYEKCLTSEDRKEALLAFAEKRKAIFKGR
jgi:enoyl-CoA hydratase/carnithine racemase